MTETSFAEFGLPDSLLAALEAIQFTTPTPIQAQAIPLAMEGRDILGSAQTGTGKTGAFVIPMLVRLMTSPEDTAMVLTPTRELASQVMQVVKSLLGADRSLRSALLIGGEPIMKQFSQLKGNPRIVVGTPGRVNDHLKRGSLSLRHTRMLVLDETDRMLDMGFGIQIDKIVSFLPEDRQTMMFSATLPPEIIRMAGNYLRSPERLAVGTPHQPATRVRQEVVHTREANKYDDLLKELEQRSGSVIVFVKTKQDADDMATRLCEDNHQADAIHGDLQQRKRERVIRSFRNQDYRILVATDIAARGLDIPHIEHVINYDLPQCPEDYIHRIGRTARGGAEGSAVSLISPRDGRKWAAITRLLNPDQDRGERGDRGDRGEQRPRSGFRSEGGRPGRRPDGRGFGGDRPEGRKFGWKERDSFARGEFGGEDRRPARGQDRDRDQDRGQDRGPSRDWGRSAGDRGRDAPQSDDRPSEGRTMTWKDGKPSMPPRRREEGGAGDRPMRSDRGQRFDAPRGGERSGGDRPQGGGRFKPRFEDRAGGEEGRQESRFNRGPRSDAPRRDWDAPRRDRDAEGSSHESAGRKGGFAPRGGAPGGKPWDRDKPQQKGGFRDGGKPSRFEGEGGRKSFGDKPRSGGDFRKGGEAGAAPSGGKPRSDRSKSSFGGGKPAFGQKPGAGGPRGGKRGGPSGGGPRRSV